MGNGDAVPNPGRAQSLPRFENFQQESAVLLRRKREPFHKRGEDLVLCAAFHIVKDSALSQQLCQRRDFVGRSASIFEQCAGNRNSGLDGPLPQLDWIEVQPFIDRVCGQCSLVDPAANRRVVDSQIARGLAECQLHVDWEKALGEKRRRRKSGKPESTPTRPE